MGNNNNNSPDFWQSLGLDATGSLVNGITGLIGNKIAFKQQKELLRRQQDFALKMWHRNNEYNTPFNQKQRLDAAGINGALAMINGRLGSGESSMPSLPSSPGYPGNPFGTFTPQSAAAYLQNKQQFAQQMALTAEQRKNQSIQNRYADLKFWSEAVKLYKEIGFTDEQIKSIMLDNQFKGRTLDDRVAQEDHRTGIMFAQENIANYEAAIKDKELQWLDPQNAAALAERNAHIQLLYAQGKLTRQQAETELYKSWGSQADALIKQKEERARTENVIKRMVQAELDHAENNKGADNDTQLYQNNSLSYGGKVAIDAAGSVANTVAKTIAKKSKGKGK